MIALWSAFRVIGVAGKLLLGRPNQGRIESGEGTDAQQHGKIGCS